MSNFVVLDLNKWQKVGDNGWILKEPIKEKPKFNCDYCEDKLMISDYNYNGDVIMFNCPKCSKS